MGVEIKVLKTLATEKAYLELLPQFEQASGNRVTTRYGGTVDVRNWLDAGEPFDLTIAASSLIDAFTEIGVQQVSELVTFPGVDYLGPLPADFQMTTTFAGGVSSAAKQPAAAATLARFLAAPEAASAFVKFGLEPARRA